MRFKKYNYIECPLTNKYTLFLKITFQKRNKNLNRFITGTMPERNEVGT